jgi:hypothetical protein
VLYHWAIPAPTSALALDINSSWTSHKTRLEFHSSFPLTLQFLCSISCYFAGYVDIMRSTCCINKDQNVHLAHFKVVMWNSMGTCTVYTLPLVYDCSNYGRNWQNCLTESLKIFCDLDLEEDAVWNDLGCINGDCGTYPTFFKNISKQSWTDAYFLSSHMRTLIKWTIWALLLDLHSDWW